MTEELKACPFCGSEAAMIYESGRDYREKNGRMETVIFWNVGCLSCGVQFTDISLPYCEAVKCWNRRK